MVRLLFIRFLAVALVVSLAGAIIVSRPNQSSAQTVQPASRCAVNICATEEPPDPCLRLVIGIFGQDLSPSAVVSAYCRVLAAYPPDPIIPALLSQLRLELPPDPC